MKTAKPNKVGGISGEERAFLKAKLATKPEFIWVYNQLVTIQTNHLSMNKFDAFLHIGEPGPQNAFPAILIEL